MGSPLERIVRTSRLEGIAGDLSDSGENDILSYVNDNQRVAQVDTVTAPGVPVAATTYTITIDGFDCDYVADGTPTQQEVAEGLRDAVNARGEVNGLVVATATATETVLTARIAGDGWTASVGAGLTLVNTTANGNASTIPFGRAVMIDGTDSPKGAKVLNGTAITDAASATALIVGVTRRDKRQELALGSDEASYAPNEAMGVVRGGRMFVEIEDALPTNLNEVFVRVSADGSLDKIGGFAGATGTGLIQWSGARWVRSAGTGLAIINLNV